MADLEHKILIPFAENAGLDDNENPLRVFSVSIASVKTSGKQPSSDKNSNYSAILRLLVMHFLFTMLFKHTFAW